MQGLQLWKEIVSRPLDWFKGADAGAWRSTRRCWAWATSSARAIASHHGGRRRAGLPRARARDPASSATALTRAAATRRRQLIRDMDADEIRNAYVLYIGAGAVATGGIISLIQALPLIVGSIARRPARPARPARRRRAAGAAAPSATCRCGSWSVGSAGAGRWRSGSPLPPLGASASSSGSTWSARC